MRRRAYSLFGHVFNRSRLANQPLRRRGVRSVSLAAERRYRRGGKDCDMIECLVKSDDDLEGVKADVLERAIRPAVPHTLGPGKWTIDVGGDRFVDFSPEPPGLQISFEETIERELAERVTADVVQNLSALTGGKYYVLWLS